MIIRDSSLVNVSIDGAQAAMLIIGPDPIVRVALGTLTAKETGRGDGAGGDAVLRVHLGQLVRQTQKAQVPVSWSMPPGLEYFDGLSGELEITDEGADCTQLTLSVLCAPDIAEPSRADARLSLQEISQATLRSIEGMVGATTSW